MAMVYDAKLRTRRKIKYFKANGRKSYDILFYDHMI